ncbi:MAG: hypothetical protein RIS77_547 [Pseudomonadota bacterium]|jgi:hypothetical protein
MNKNNPIGVALLMIGWGDTKTNNKTDDAENNAADRKPRDQLS